MALYNNGYPVNYPQFYAPQMQNNNNNSIIWVQGEAGAKSYLVAPNNTVQLWDSEDNVIYLKSADSSGMPSIKVLDYTIRENAPQNVKNSLKNDSAFVTKEEFEKFKSELKQSRLTEEDENGKLPF